MSKLGALIMVLALVFMLSGCTQKSAAMQDGYYSAEAAALDSHGWKEFVTICVKSGKIVTVEYNAKNASGFVKSWDTHYMRDMNATYHTYPNKYTRQYGSDLLNKQNPDEVDAVTGATHSHDSFQILVRAAIRQADEGAAGVMYVDLPVNE